MAIAYVNKQETTAASVSSVSAAVPAGYTAGNYFVMSALVGVSAQTVSTPAGWTLVLGPVSVGVSPQYLYVWLKKVTASESNPTLTASAGGAYFEVVIEEYSGVDGTTPQSGTASAGTPDNDAVVNTPGITTAVANSMLLYFLGDEAGGSGNTITVPSGATLRHNSYFATSGARLVASELLIAAAGAVAATSHGRTSTSFPATAAVMGLRPAVVVAAPVADFTGTPLTGTWPLSVAFTDTSTNSPTSWAWTFGDGGTSTSQNPTHSYTAAGTYTVTLTATNAGGSNVKTRTGYVTVSNPSGTFTKIKWGNRLVVTDEGGGVIRVDFV